MRKYLLFLSKISHLLREECIRNFGKETCVKHSFGRTRRRCGNIQIDLSDASCMVEGGWINVRILSSDGLCC